LVYNNEGNGLLELLGIEFIRIYDMKNWRKDVNILWRDGLIYNKDMFI
jgi:hypothetical protein